MATIRQSVVAGMFYPENPEQLKTTIKNLLDEAHSYASLPIPKAIIAPHAGYAYSGKIAASAYACLQNVKKPIKNVILLAPTHYYTFNGIATTAANFYATPLGNIKIAQDKITALIPTVKGFSFCEEAFTYEHAIEVHLPFLLSTLGDNFSLIPLLVGSTPIPQVESILDKLWNGLETLIIISSDLSHYHDYVTAKKHDQKTADLIVQLNTNALTVEDACGVFPLRGFLSIANKKKLTAKIIDLRNSGDTSGDKNRVVGYGAFHFLQK